MPCFWVRAVRPCGAALTVTPALCAGDLKRVGDIVDKMVEKKISIRIEDTEMGQMPLHKLARVGDKPQAESLIRKLLETGGEARLDINYQDGTGKSPLHLACESSQVGLAKLLLDRGSDPTLTTKTGWTALHSAVHSTSIPVVKAILESPRVKAKKAALVKHADLSGRTALHIAAFRCRAVPHAALSLEPRLES